MNKKKYFCFIFFITSSLKCCHNNFLNPKINVLFWIANMFLHSLKIDNYKNLDKLKFSFNKKINCFIGKNGIGKTNIIDSIYHLAFTKSYFNPSTSQNVKIGQDYFSINGDFEINNRDENVHCYFKNGEKKVIKRNSKLYKRNLLFFRRLFTRVSLDFNSSNNCNTLHNCGWFAIGNLLFFCSLFLGSYRNVGTILTNSGINGSVSFIMCIFWIYTGCLVFTK